MHVIDDDQILRMNITLIGMIPKRAAVLDVLAGLFEEYVMPRLCRTKDRRSMVLSSFA
jgi:hypothetical protein